MFHIQLYRVLLQAKYEVLDREIYATGAPQAAQQPLA